MKSFTSPFDENADDVNLVESQSNEKNNTTTSSSSTTAKKPTSSIWQTFANIIDRVLFVTLFLIYLFMVIDLLPENFFSKTPERSVEIIGY